MSFSFTFSMPTKWPTSSDNRSNGTRTRRWTTNSSTCECGTIDALPPNGSFDLSEGTDLFSFYVIFFSFRDEICFIKLLERENGLSPKMSALLVSSIYLQLRCSIHYKVNPCFCYRKSVTKDWIQSILGHQWRVSHELSREKSTTFEAPRLARCSPPGTRYFMKHFLLSEHTKYA